MIWLFFFYRKRLLYIFEAFIFSFYLCWVTNIKKNLKLKKLYSTPTHVTLLQHFYLLFRKSREKFLLQQNNKCANTRIKKFANLIYSVVIEMKTTQSFKQLKETKSMLFFMVSLSRDEITRKVFLRFTVATIYNLKSFSKFSCQTAKRTCFIWVFNDFYLNKKSKILFYVVVSGWFFSTVYIL